MLFTTAKAIEVAAKECDLEVTIREDYSGRGMVGRTTTAVVSRGSRADFDHALAYAAYLLGKNNASEGEVEAFMADVRTIRCDNLGYDVIAY